MKPSTDLFDLIKSLSRAEKRYFKVFSTAVSGKEDSVYQTLFDLMDEMDEYDERALFEKWKGLRIKNKLADTKGYLYNAILKSLLQYAGYSSIAIQTNLYLGYVELLYQKGLFRQAIKFIQKGKQKFSEQNNYYAYDSLCDWENRIYMNAYDFPKVIDVMNQQQQALAKRQTELDFRKRTLSIYRHTSSPHTLTKQDLQQLNKEVSFFLNLPNLQEMDLRLRYYAYSALGYYYQVVNDGKRCLLYHKLNLDMLLQNTAFRIANERFFLSAFQNYCNALLGQEQIGEVKIELGRLREWVQQQVTGLKAGVKADSLFIIANTEILIYNQHLQGYEPEELEKNVSKLTTDYKRHIRPPELYILQFNLAATLFMLGQYAKALDYLRPILGFKTTKSVSELVLAARIFSIIILYELNETALVNNIIPTIQKYLKRRKLKLEIEENLFLFLRSSNPQKQNSIRVKLLRLLRQEDKHKISIVGNYVNLENWLTQKESDGR